MPSVKKAALSGLLVLTALSIVAFGSSTCARADVYDFRYVDVATNGAEVTASGTITTGAYEDNGYIDVTAITGTRNGFPITGLLPVNAYADNDNLFSLTQATYFDFPGVSFSAADGYDYNMSSDGTSANGYLDDSSLTDPGGFAQTEIELTITAVPEPASMALFAAIVLVLGVIRRQWSRTTPTAG